MEIDAPAVRKVELRRNGQHAGFAVAQEEGVHTARYPHVYGMREDMRMTLRVQGSAGAAVEVLIDGAAAGALQLTETLTDWAEKEIPLRNAPGEHDVTLRMTGRMTLDWFRLRD